MELKKIIFYMCIAVTGIFFFSFFVDIIKKKENFSKNRDFGIALVSLIITIISSPLADANTGGSSSGVEASENSVSILSTRLISMETTAAVVTTKAPPTIAKPKSSPAGTPLEPGKSRAYSNELENGKINRKSFVAPVTGQYRFDFDISDATCDYCCAVIDSRGEEVGSRYYSSSEHGMNVTLASGETYSMVVRQTKGSSRYTITLHVPKGPIRVES